MPVYEYQCKAGHITEDLHLLDVRPEKIKCHTCGKQARFILSATPGKVRNPAVPRRSR